VKIRAFILAVAAMLLVACNDGEKTTKNMIQQKDFSDGDHLLKAVVGDKSFYYEYSAEKGKFLRVWVERYEYGKLAEKAGGVGIGMTEDAKGEMLFYFLEDSEWDNYYLRKVITDESGYAVSNSQIPKPDEKLGAGTWGPVINDKMEFTEDMVLGYMAFFEADDGNSVSFRTNVTDPKEFIEENGDVPLLYLIRASLSDEDEWDWNNETGKE